MWHICLPETGDEDRQPVGLQKMRESGMANYYKKKKHILKLMVEFYIKQMVCYVYGRSPMVKMVIYKNRINVI